MNGQRTLVVSTELLDLVEIESAPDAILVMTSALFVEEEDIGQETAERNAEDVAEADLETEEVDQEDRGRNYNFNYIEINASFVTPGNVEGVLIF